MGANHVNAIWEAEHDQALTAFLVNGMSMARIATEINDKFDTQYSRNAVCGRAFRLKLNAPKKPKMAPKPRKPQPYRPRPKHLPAPNIEAIQCVEVKPRNLSLLELEPDDCRYPVNNESPFVFCGHPHVVYIKDGVEITSSYCTAHFRLSISNGTAAERRASQMVNA